MLEALGQLAKLVLQRPYVIPELPTQRDEGLTILHSARAAAEKPRRRAVEKSGEPGKVSEGENDSRFVTLKGAHRDSQSLGELALSQSSLPSELGDASTHDGGGIVIVADEFWHR